MSEKPRLPFARSFHDLVVYQKARELQSRVFELSKKFSKDETYSLTDQIRRAARSIGAQIAEAWAKRDYEKHFVSKSSDADAEQMETQHWITTAVDAAYLDRATGRELFRLSVEIGRLLGSMKARAGEFCPSPETAVVHEFPDDCFSTRSDEFLLSTEH